MRNSIEHWQPAESDLHRLAELLQACVHAGASVGFILPFTMSDALAFWRDKVLPDAIAGHCRVLVARNEGSIVGTVQLRPAVMPNQAHRADVAKLLVLPAARRQGIARALMIAVEELSRQQGRTLLTLDTVSGSPAQSLYESLGYRFAGAIPGYARAPSSPQLEPTTILYKDLMAPATLENIADAV